MVIKVARGVAEEILGFPDQIKLQVQRADDPAAAAEALVNAAEEIEQLGSDFLSDDGEPLTPNSVGGVVVVPSGSFLTGINAPMVPESELARIPDIVARHLAAEGVKNAVIALPPDTGPLDDIENTPRAVILRLFVAPLTSPDPAPTPAWLLELASTWLLEHSSDELINVRASVVQFPLLRHDVAAYVDTFPRFGSPVLTGGSLASRAWGVHLDAASVAFAFGGPEATDAELVAMVGSFAELTRQVAPRLVQGFIDISRRFAPFSTTLHGTTWSIQGGASPELVVYVDDELCFDAFAYQVLGPGHVARLVAAAPEGRLPAPFRPLPAGRVELSVGEPADWLPASPQRDRVLAEARRLLAPCLPGLEEALQVRRARRAERLSAQAAASEDHEGNQS